MDNSTVQIFLDTSNFFFVTRPINTNYIYFKASHFVGSELFRIAQTESIHVLKLEFGRAEFFLDMLKK